MYLLLGPSSRIIQHELLYNQPCFHRGYFETSAPNEIKLTSRSTRWKEPHICLTTCSTPKSQISSRVVLCHLFLSHGSFLGKVHRMIQNDIKHYKIKDAPFTSCKCPRVTNFTSFHSTISHFKVWYLFHFLIRTIININIFENISWNFENYKN